MKRCFNKAFPTLGPMPLADLTGHGVAALELMASTRPKTKHASHSQYDTIRKLRSALSSLRTASPQGGSPNLKAGRDLRGSSIILFDFPTDSEWWKRFLLGMKIRMGQDVRPQKLGFSQQAGRLLEGFAKGEPKENTLGALAYSSFSFTIRPSRK